MKRRTLLIGGAAALAGATGYGVWSAKNSAANYAAYNSHLRRPLDLDGGLAELVRMATLAPNGHNTQPWRFNAGDQSLVMRPDFSRRTPVVDPDDHHIFVSLGAAAENIALAGAAMGLPGVLEIAITGFVNYEFGRGKPASDPLTSAIVKRQSTRSLYDGSTVDAATLNALAVAGKRDGVRLVLITERRKIDAVRDLVVAGNNAQMDDPAFITELKQWLRFSSQNAMQRGDGLYSAASGSPALPEFIGRPAFDFVFKKKSEADKYAAQLNSSAGAAVFFADKANGLGWAKVGGAAQRFLLEATRLGLACAFVNQPVEVAHLRPDLAALVGEKGLRPDLVIRFGRAAPLPFSPRRSLEDILVRQFPPVSPVR